MNIAGLEHIEEPFHWGIAMDLLGEGYKITDPFTPADDYIYWCKKRNCYISVYNNEESVKVFSSMERVHTQYKLVL